jgi:hypothetical protein
MGGLPGAAVAHKGLTVIGNANNARKAAELFYGPQTLAACRSALRQGRGSSCLWLAPCDQRKGAPPLKRRQNFGLLLSASIGDGGAVHGADRQ